MLEPDVVRFDPSWRFLIVHNQRLQLAIQNLHPSTSYPRQEDIEWIVRVIGTTASSIKIARGMCSGYPDSNDGPNASYYYFYTAAAYMANLSERLHEMGRAMTKTLFVDKHDWPKSF